MKNTTPLRYLLLAAAVALATWLVSAAPAEPPRDIDKLIDQLGSPSWKQRDRASRALAEAGPGIVMKLRRVQATTEDVEVMSRIDEILQQVQRRLFHFEGVLAERVGADSFAHFDQSSQHQKRSMLSTLARQGKAPAAPVLAAVAEMDDDPVIRQTALDLLMHLVDSQAAETLEALSPPISTPAALARIRALALLGKTKVALDDWSELVEHLGRPDIVKHAADTWTLLVGRLPEPDPAVDAAINRLAKLLPPGGTPPRGGTPQRTTVEILSRALQQLGSGSRHDRALLAGLAARIRLDPDSADQALAATRSLALRGRYDTLHRLFRMVPRGDESIETTTLRWLAAAQTGQPSGTQKQELQRAADSIDKQLTVARLLDRLGKPDLATPWWTRAATGADDPQRSTHIRLMLAQRYTARGDLDGAAEQLGIAMQLSGDKAMVNQHELTDSLNRKVQQLGSRLLGQGRAKLVWEMTEGASVSRAPSLLVLVVRQLAGRRLGHDTSALQAHIDKLAAQPEMTLAAVQTLIDLEAPDQAAELLAKVRPEGPPQQRVALLGRVATLAARLNRPDEAVQALEDATKLVDGPAAGDALRGALLQTSRTLLDHLHTRQVLQVTGMVPAVAHDDAAAQLEAIYLGVMAAGDLEQPVDDLLARARKVEATRDQRFALAERLASLGRIDLARLEYRELSNAPGSPDVYVRARLELARLAGSGPEPELPDMVEHLQRAEKLIKQKTGLADGGAQARRGLLDTSVDLAARAWRLGKLEQARTLTEQVHKDDWRDTRLLWLRYLIKRDRDRPAAEHLLESLHDEQFDKLGNLTAAVDRLRALGGHEAALVELGRTPHDADLDDRVNLLCRRFVLALELVRVEVAQGTARQLKQYLDKHNPEADQPAARLYGRLSEVLVDQAHRPGGLPDGLVQSLWSPGKSPTIDAMARTLTAPADKPVVTFKGLWPDGLPQQGEVVRALFELDRLGAGATLDGLTREVTDTPGADRLLTLSLKTIRAAGLARRGHFADAARGYVEVLRSAEGFDAERMLSMDVLHDQATQLIASTLMLGQTSRTLDLLEEVPAHPPQQAARQVLLKLCRYDPATGPFVPDPLDHGGSVGTSINGVAMMLADLGHPEVALAMYGQSFDRATEQHEKINACLRALELAGDLRRFDDALAWLDRLETMVRGQGHTLAFSGIDSIPIRRLALRALVLIENKQAEKARRLLTMHISDPELVPLMETPGLALAWRRLGDEGSLQKLAAGARAEVTNRQRLYDIYPSQLNGMAWPLRDFPELLDGAVEASRRSVELDPTNAPCLDTLAELLHRQGKHKEALTAIGRSLAAPVPKRWTYYLGQKMKFEKHLREATDG